MKPILFSALILFAGLAPTPLSAHCQVPCGIYGDEAKHVELVQHAETIKKALAKMGELAAKTDPQSQQQFVRWVNNKESHAQLIQEEVLNYFLAQRIKVDQPSKEGYQAQLEAAHEIVVAAMKCKQSADPKVAEALEVALKSFHEKMK